MAENLNHLLSVDHFFNKAVHLAQTLLLLYEKDAAVSHKCLQYPEQDKDKHHDKSGKAHA